MTPDGRIPLAIDPPCTVPFASQSDGSQARRLLELNELDVTRDVLEFKYRLNDGDQEPSNVKFDLLITEWTETSMNLKLDFEDPTAASTGKTLDQFYIKIKNPKLFVSLESGESMSSDFETMSDLIPQQVGKDVDYPALVIMAK